MIGVESYGIGAVHFDYVIAADNPQGSSNDWERTYHTNITNSLFIGETENFGKLRQFQIFTCHPISLLE